MMTMAALLSVVIGFGVLLSASASSSASNHALIYDLWDSIVEQYVSPGVMQGVSVNVIDYKGIQSNPNLSRYMDEVSQANVSGLDRASTYSFFINVYNAFAINMVIKNPCKKSLLSHCEPISSIKDIGSLIKPVWIMPAGVVGGKTYSLDDVENFLRNPSPFKEDSRLHACIVCASISCPNVRQEAFRPEKIGTQMDGQVRDFLSNNKKGFSLDTQSSTAHYSSIFKWFSGDFDSYGGVQNFTYPYLPPSDVAFMQKHNVDIEYFDYNWNLNGVPPCDCAHE